MALSRQGSTRTFPLPFPAPRYGYRHADSDATPAVSIITAYYNTGPLFSETVVAVLRQSLQQWEWIIVNDGSTDAAALRALLPLRHADARIRVIDTANRGVSAARNTGVAASRAPLLFFLDSDDLIGPTTLEKLAWTLHARPQSAFTSGWVVAFGETNLLWPRGFDTRYAFPYENMACTQAMVRRTAFEQVGGFDEARRAGLEDFEFWMRSAAHGVWGHDVREYLIWSRRKAPEQYRSYRWAFQDGPQAERVLRRELRERYPQLFRNGVPSVATGGGLLDTYTPVPTNLPFANRLERPDGQRRVLLLLPWIRMGGADRFALDLVAGLQARGDRVTVCLLRDVEHTWLDALQALTEDVFTLSAFLPISDYPRFLHYLIESRQITTVLINNALLGYQLLPYLRSRCPSVAYVDYLHMENEEWRSGGYARSALDHDGLLDLHITCSDHLRHWLIERHADPTRVEVCYIGIDPQQWQPDANLRASVRAELGIATNMPVILFAARLAPEKRPDFAMEILRAVRDKGHSFVCLVAGDGEHRRSMERFIRRHNLQNSVRLLGAVPHSRVRELLAASDMLLLPSAQEGIALMLYEALAMGVVPVAADVGGQKELVTPDCGVLVPLGDDELAAYSDALGRLLDDHCLQTALGSAGRARIGAHFTTEGMLDRMQSLIDGATDRPPRPPVSAGAGLAAAALAIEHYQLETRLRGLLPVRMVLSLRQSAWWRPVMYLLALRQSLGRVDRTLYAARREVMRALRSWMPKRSI